MDMFFNSNKLYGFPMHCTNLLIPDSFNNEYPFVLDNFDKALYVGKDYLGLYGSMPLLIIESLGYFICLIWKNASRTWMDVKRE